MDGVRRVSVDEGARSNYFAAGLTVDDFVDGGRRKQVWKNEDSSGESADNAENAADKESYDETFHC
jgi:hypothetical protein